MSYKIMELKKDFSAGDQVFRKGFFDSAMLKVQYDGEDVEHTVAVREVNYDCILTGTSINLDPSEAKLPCMNLDHLTLFKLNENWVQDIYTYYSKEYTINKKRSMGNTLKVDRVLNHNFQYHVGPPYIGE
jgi:hypothetical protein